MFFGSEAPGTDMTEIDDLKSTIVFFLLPENVYLCVSLPVALAYTTLACGSLLCRSRTALPIFVDVAFLALWHSSKIIYIDAKSRTKKYQKPLLNVRLLKLSQEIMWNNISKDSLC